MNPECFLRQLDIADPAKFKDMPITVIGAGGIGAATVVALAKTGFEKITVYDFDTIEDHNMPNQLLPLWQDVAYTDSDNLPFLDWAPTLGEHKASALYNLVYRLAGVEIKAELVPYEDQPLTSVVVSAVDSLDARRLIWEQVLRSIDTDFFLDGRMAITSMDLYAVDMLNQNAIDQYAASLGGEAEELPCTARATMFNSFIIAGHLTALLVAKLNGWPYPSRFYYNVRSWKTLTENA
jgi:hypothetical protein